MKKLLTLIIIAIILTSCGTYHFQSHNSKRVYTYKRCGIKYTITDISIREVKTDTLKIK